MSNAIDQRKELINMVEDLLLIAKKQQEEIERLKLVIALLRDTPPKKKRGRPRKTPVEKPPPGRPKTLKEFGYVEEIEEAKIKYNEKTDVGAIKAIARDVAKENGLGEFRVDDSDIKSFIKTVRTRLSKERRRIKESQKTSK